MQNSWYGPLRQIRSLGSQKSKIAHMGELAEQRRQHLGQFFTPDAVAAFMWRIVSGHTFHTILDNSIGSGRLIQFADPGKHAIYGEVVESVLAEVAMRLRAVFYLPATTFKEEDANVLTSIMVFGEPRPHSVDAQRTEKPRRRNGSVPRWHLD